MNLGSAVNIYSDLLNLPGYGDGQSMPDSRERRRPSQCDGSLGAFLCEQAHRLLQHTLAAEFEEFLARTAHYVDENGRLAVVRNGFHPERHFRTPLGPIPIRIPRVRSQIARPVAFHSMLLRPYARGNRANGRESAWRFLRALSTADLPEGLHALLGSPVPAVLPSVMARVTQQWQSNHCACLTGSLAELDYCSLWIESLSRDERASGVGGEVLIAVGIDEPDQRRLLATADGVRETAQTWVRRLGQLHERGLPRPPSVRLGPGVSADVVEAVARVYPQRTQVS